MKTGRYGVFATYYDRMMENIPYEEWEQYLLQLLYLCRVPACGKITELGCGTGIMTGLLAREGFRMTGIDLSGQMLAEAGRKETDDPVIYRNADMRSYIAPEEQDAVISICDTMNYLVSLRDLCLTFRSVRASLKPGGVFVFDLKTEYFFDKILDGKRYTGKLSDASYVWENHYDREKRLHAYELTFRGKERGALPEKEVHYQRAFRGEEIKNEAKRAGFLKAKAFDAFTMDRPRKRSERIYIVLFR